MYSTGWESWGTKGETTQSYRRCRYDIQRFWWKRHYIWCTCGAWVSLVSPVCKYVTLVFIIFEKKKNTLQNFCNDVIHICGNVWLCNSWSVTMVFCRMENTSGVTEACSWERKDPPQECNPTNCTWLLLTLECRCVQIMLNRTCAIPENIHTIPWRLFYWCECRWVAKSCFSVSSPSISEKKKTVGIFMTRFLVSHVSFHTSSSPPPKPILKLLFCGRGSFCLAFVHDRCSSVQTIFLLDKYSKCRAWSV